MKKIIPALTGLLCISCSVLLGQGAQTLAEQARALREAVAPMQARQGLAGRAQEFARLTRELKEAQAPAAATPLGKPVQPAATPKIASQTLSERRKQEAAARRQRDMAQRAATALGDKRPSFRERVSTTAREYQRRAGETFRRLEKAVREEARTTQRGLRGAIVGKQRR